MGFEPQITRIISNTRPDRQSVMFSATFPRQVETLARITLTDPVEIIVGGRSVANTDVVQSVEIRSEDEKFYRLLELLGEWIEVCRRSTKTKTVIICCNALVPFLFESSSGKTE